jgi:cupin 2 domain-containing protein
MTLGNLFDNVPAELPEEFSETLLEGHGKFRVERIVSRGHASPSDFWFDQDLPEWVTLISGSAVLQFDDESEDLEMKPGDWIEIPAHRRHRVAKTSDADDTVWLAIHWG